MIITSYYIMNIIAPIVNRNVVSLEELIPESNCLRILILHTPFYLKLQSLGQCINLVKLDLSKNNLQTFPYIGHFRYLKFMFLHQNKLSADQLRGIFQINCQKSSLSQNIVWVTFWGNKDSFLGRHFLANETNAIACDHHIIVQQQRAASIMHNVQCLSEQTDISNFLNQTTVMNDSTNEEQYLENLWHQLRLLRKKYEQLNPIIKIQKVFRGWIQRQTLQRLVKNEQNNYLLLLQSFKEWKRLTKNSKRLFVILQQSKKARLLFGHRIDRKYIYERLLQKCQQAKTRVKHRKILLRSEMKFYATLWNNYMMFQDLYKHLYVQNSKAIYIYQPDWQLFQQYIIPFVKLFNTADIVASSNLYFHLHYLHEQQDSTKRYKQFINIMQTNTKSIITSHKLLSNLLQVFHFKKSTVFAKNIVNRYGVVHLSKAKKEKIYQNEKNLDQNSRLQKDQLIKVEGDTRILKDIIRGVFFFNSRRFKLTEGATKRINVLTEQTIRRISSAIVIQRAWKGYFHRKRHESDIILIMKYQRAAMTIQRWFRRLPYNNRRLFMLKVALKLRQIASKTFYIEITDYFNLLNNKTTKQLLLLQKNFQVYINKQTQQLFLTWDQGSSNQQIIQMINIKKPLFPQYFMKENGLINRDISSINNLSLEQVQKGDFQHLLFYKTQSSLVSKLGKKYLQIQCKSKQECKLRILGIYLMSYDIKKKEGIEIYKQDFMKVEVSRKLIGSRRQMNFICNENINMIKTVELSCRQNKKVDIFMIQNKIYLQPEAEKRPIKIEERFFIYIFNQQSDQKNELAVIKKLKSARLNTEISIQQLSAQKCFETESSQNLNPLLFKDTRKSIDRQIIVKKKSVKQFKAEVRKKKLPQINFILDNINSNKPKNCSSLKQLEREENLTKRINSISEISDNTKQSKQNYRKFYIQRRIQTEQKRQIQRFSSQFVNVSNFLQCQFANDEVRRINTQLQRSAIVSAEEVRFSHQRLASQRENKISFRRKRIREMHANHKEMIEKRQIQAKQHSLQLKEHLSAQKKKKGQQSNVKRLKVSFVEQNFPIITRQRKSEKKT